MTYIAGSHGTITGTNPQNVTYGSDCAPVTATPNPGYHFVDWSDNLTNATRTDTNITTTISYTANFAINSYTLTYTAGANGSISGTSPQTVSHGGNGTTVIAIPNANYHFTSWSDGNLSASRTDTNIIGDLNITANFAIDTHTLTYDAGANGTITGTTPQTVNHGADGTAVVATPNSGYHFVSWSDGNLNATRTDTNVTENITVTANFSNALTVTYIAGSHGTITGTTPQNVSYGGNGTAVTAVPNAGYHFTDWNDGSSTATRTDTNITGDISYTANFAINTYTLTYAAGANGSISGTSPQTVNYNTSGTAITATADSGYHFINWSDGSTQNPRTDTNVSNNISVTANFSDALTLSYIVGPNGSIIGTTPQTVTQNGDGTAVTAVPNAGYRFVDWSDGDSNATRTDTHITTDLTVTANFSINTFTLKYKSDSNGKIDGDSTQTVNYGQDGSSVTPNPDTGYKFKEWSDGNNDSPRKDKDVKENLTVTASYEKRSYDLSYKAGDNGSISGDTTQTVKYEDDGNKVTAVPDEGYRFTDWSDGSNDNPRKDTNIKDDLKVTANFAPGNTSATMTEPVNTHTISYDAGANGTISRQASQTGEGGMVVTAIPNAGYHFVDWSDGSTRNPRTDSNVSQDMTVTAHFAADTAGTTANQGGDQTANSQDNKSNQNDEKTSNVSDSNTKDQSEKNTAIADVKENKDEEISISPILPIIPQEQQAPAEVATAIALSTTLLPLLYQVGSIKNGAVLFRSLLLGFLGLTTKATKRKTWGTVYDSVTGDPIPFVSISVIDAKDGKVKESKLTDKFGSYYFLVPEGEYQLEIKKKGYEIDSHDIDAKTHYANVLEEPDKKKLVYDAPGIIFYDICLRSTDPNQKSIKEKRLSRFFFAAVFYLGFVLIILAYLSSPTKLNLFMVVVYLINILMRNVAYLGSKWGQVYDSRGIKQPFSAISLLDRTSKQLVARTVSDEQGRYILLANPGEYILKTITNINQFAQNEEEFSLVDRGAIKKKIVVQ